MPSQHLRIFSIYFQFWLYIQYSFILRSLLLIVFPFYHYNLQIIAVVTLLFVNCDYVILLFHFTKLVSWKHNLFLFLGSFYLEFFKFNRAHSWLRDKKYWNAPIGSFIGKDERSKFSRGSSTKCFADVNYTDYVCYNGKLAFLYYFWCLRVKIKQKFL